MVTSDPEALITSGTAVYAREAETAGARSHGRRRGGETAGGIAVFESREDDERQRTS